MVQKSKITLSLLLATASLISSPPYTCKNDLPPRVEWDENHGYCGEISFVIAGLYFGQYCSQYTARAIASNGAPQHLMSSQLIIGSNDMEAAKKMRLRYEAWGYENQSSPPQGTTDEFLVWIKHHVCQGHPVAIGLFNNEYILYQDSDPNAGQSDYDHIVVVTGIGSDSKPIDDGMYHGTDRIYITDNGLYTPDDSPIFYFDYGFDDVQLTRQEANAPQGPVYSLLDQPNHYGIAILGVEDDDHVTAAVNLKVNVDSEEPEITDGGDTPPAPMPITLTVTISNLAPSTTYNVYLYDGFEQVPTKSFNANSGNVKKKFEIHTTDKGGTYTMCYPLMSDEVAIFRAVPVTAP